jgi:cation diffusion facilitator family transporter
MPVSNNNTKAISITIWVGIGIMLLKFYAYFLTHSNAILSDALESIINVVAGLFAFYSVRLAAKPKDLEHPYGHGKIEFISAGFEGGLILVSGIIIIIKSVNNLIHPIDIHDMDKGAWIAAIAGIANYFLGMYLIRKGKQSKSIVLVADGKHLQSDTWTSIGLVAGVVIIHFTSFMWMDSVLAIVFACAIVFTGYKLIRKSLAGLMDEADSDILKEVLEVLSNHRKPEWIDIHNLRIQQYGSSFHIDCHVTLPWYNNLQHSHDELKKMEDLIQEKFHSQVELFIHPDPCIPSSCSICRIKDCKVRQHPFEQSLNWTLDNVLKNQKHML